MEKIFYTDPHIVDFEAAVTACRLDEASGLYLTVLDRTAFFPEEGGQTADQGTLDGKSVLDVRIRDNIIYHVMDAPLEPGRTVKGHVDWEQRFDFMQQHSGEHIISGLVHKRFGYHNTGFHLGLKEVTLDFNGVITPDEMREIEWDANKVIWRNLPVVISVPPKELLDKMEYRSKLALEQDVRIVEIPGVDTCACCAPHVDATGQIGLLKVTNIQSHRGGVRVNILCGSRALAHYSQCQDSVSAVSVLLSASPDKTAGAAARLKEENQRLKDRGNELQAQLLQMKLEALPAPGTVSNVALFTGSLDTIAIRRAVNSLCEKYDGYCGIFTPEGDGSSHTFIIGSRVCDCRQLAETLRNTLGAKCGGSAPMIQGSVRASQEQLYRFFRQ